MCTVLVYLIKYYSMDIFHRIDESVVRVFKDEFNKLFQIDHIIVVSIDPFHNQCDVFLLNRNI